MNNSNNNKSIYIVAQQNWMRGMLEQTTATQQAQSSALLAQWLMTQQAMMLSTPAARNVTPAAWPSTPLFGQPNVLNECVNNDTIYVLQ
jgi:hypothetical protein